MSARWLGRLVGVALCGCLAFGVPAMAKGGADGLKATYSIGADISGTFYDPAQNGHGFVLQQIVSNGQPVLLATWFTYQGGQARWLIGVGNTSGNEARIPLSITTGGDFPPRFVPAATQIQPWGELVLRFDNKDRGTATWTTSYAGFNNGSMPLQRLTQPASAFESTAGRVAACHSGSWYDPAQSGHGIFTEVLGSGSSRQLLAIWYAYLNGEQRWMTALGPINGNSATLTATITSGAQFPPNFNPSQVVSQPWGTMTFTAVDADRASWSWNSTVAGFGSGSLNLTRLSTLTGSDCGPSSDKDAARFLTQATFGPTGNDIASVRSLGYAAWIDAQIALAPTLQRPTIEQQVAAQVLTDPRNAQFYRAYRLERWFNSALYAPDQLRQRVAFALSQIVVLSEVGHAGQQSDRRSRVQRHPVAQCLRQLPQPAARCDLQPDDGRLPDPFAQPEDRLDPGRQQQPGCRTGAAGRELRARGDATVLDRPDRAQPRLLADPAQWRGHPDLHPGSGHQHCASADRPGYTCTGPATIGTVFINRNCGTTAGTTAAISRPRCSSPPPAATQSRAR
jgi:hypothetical protein